MDPNVFDLDWRLGGRKPSLSELAYERIEELFISTQLAPGSFVRMADLQSMVGVGRTPVHQAVRRLATETLLEIRPRDGLTVTPIDLTRERRLTDLRQALEGFVMEEAARNLSSNHRAGLLHLRRSLVSLGDDATLATFNLFDRSFDRLMIAAAREPFLEQSLRPLHAFARRVGHVHLTHFSGAGGLATTIERHLRILDAVVAGDAEKAKAATDEVIQLSRMFIDDLSASVDPTMLDSRLSRLPTGGTAQPDQFGPGLRS
ncbi:GntR family transcriptional regulator [Acuticoccus kandeliae]|uniref:GntR family transcriptional regulator n=1 Tax=Acuticoccus kandeliae TaxID=2073160 RepID=UPI000D3E082F|nr:GntR family transcriptional regulator [Acuticoccus kandeliae]